MQISFLYTPGQYILLKITISGANLLTRKQYRLAGMAETNKVNL